MEMQPDAKKSNPLAGYFRRPAIYLRLPSQGRFWPDDAIDYPPNGEIEVYPMTTKDEIILRTPDALLNGAGMITVMQSCCPNIKDGWKTPSVDVDAILIAIRIASYGEELDFETSCPHCEAENAHAVDLRIILDAIKCPDYSQKIEFHDIKIKLRPQAYFAANKASMIGFEEQKIIQVLNNAELDNEVKSIEITKSMNKLTEISIATLAASTDYIELGDGNIVREQEYINEFYQNVENKLVKELQLKIAELNEQVQVQPQQVQCAECHKPYTVPLDFNFSNFFGKGF